ncbi:MAG: DUF296 domain-containing protein [Peptococcaceae bacterium]|jgi:predicted DNA-binding protein with PD1-like motif|nr:DUF296 domain-containing protein [Peptococcaceae bacterium]
MKYAEAQLGRIFILKLEHGDRLPGVIEAFAQEHHIQTGLVHFLGGADEDSRIVAGPEDQDLSNIKPMVTPLSGTSEAFGTGTLFTHEAEGVPKLHMHAAFGRGGGTITGCTREGVGVWLMGEAVIYELLNTTAHLAMDPATGFAGLTFHAIRDRNQLLEAIAQGIAAQGIDDREAAILKARYGLGENSATMTLEEIGNRYHSSREEIRQIEVKVLRYLRS